MGHLKPPVWEQSKFWKFFVSDQSALLVKGFSCQILSCPARILLHATFGIQLVSYTKSQFESQEKYFLIYVKAEILLKLVMESTSLFKECFGLEANLGL